MVLAPFGVACLLHEKSTSEQAARQEIEQRSEHLTGLESMMHMTEDIPSSKQHFDADMR
jgi:hypothetical protein